LNFTLALLAGLVLLLPGLTAVASWNFRGSTTTAKRPELQLTSVTALFLALAVALLMHLLGFALIALAWTAASELGTELPAAFPRFPLAPNPYEMAIDVATGRARPSATSLFVFGLVIAAECLLAWRLTASQGLDLALEDADVRSQGWVFEHIVRPSRHGYKPIAFVLTNPPQGEYGIGYEGIVAEVRQGDHGELKFLTLAEPQSFVYQVTTPHPDQPRRKPRLEIHDRKWVGGIVALEAAAIRNVVIHNVPAELVDAVEALPDGLAGDEAEPGSEDPPLAPPAGKQEQ
jgi:hypothetical protein